MTREMDDASLLFNAAASVSGTIKEVDEIEWPVCAAHGDDRMARASDGEEPVALSDDFLFDGPSRSSTACRGGGVSARDMRLPR